MQYQTGTTITNSWTAGDGIPFIMNKTTLNLGYWSAIITASTFIIWIISFVGIFMLLRKKISITLFSIIFSIIVLLDMWPVVARYINKDSFEAKAANESNILPSKADEFILADKSLDFRVFQFGNPFNDASTSYFHKSIGVIHSGVSIIARISK